ncbi:MAG: hypothetical protein PWQ12_1774 [Clostridiales bacterium]|jgi:preprotein translocase subunit SecE|nr:hypothetical protein [Clostridiales bacterium]
MDRETVLFKILKKMEASIDRILLLTGMIVVLLGFSLFYMNGMRFFSFFDMVAGVGCLTAFVSRKKLSAKFKLILLLVLLMVFSFFSLVFNGFVGNGMLTLAISQVLAAFFLRKAWQCTDIAARDFDGFIRHGLFCFGVQHPDRVFGAV